MQSPRLLSVRVNSEDADPFSAAPLYYGADSHTKHGDEHRTHTSVWSSILPRPNHSSICLPSSVAPRSKQFSCVQTDESW